MKANLAKYWHQAKEPACYINTVTAHVPSARRSKRYCSPQGGWMGDQKGGRIQEGAELLEPEEGRQRCHSRSRQ